MEMSMEDERESLTCTHPATQILDGHYFVVYVQNDVQMNVLANKSTFGNVYGLQRWMETAFADSK